MLAEYAFDELALAWVRQQFTWPSALSKRLATLDLAEGSVRTCLPKGTPINKASDFRSIHVTGMGKTRRWLLPLIRRFLKGDARRVAVFETMWMPTDSGLPSRMCRAFFGGDDVYHLASATSTQTQLEEAVNDARHYPFVGVLTSIGPNSRRIRDGASVSVDRIHELADRAQGVIVEAYDDEGRLVWIRKGCEDLWQPCISDPEPESRV